MKDTFVQLHNTALCSLARETADYARRAKVKAVECHGRPVRLAPHKFKSGKRFQKWPVNPSDPLTTLPWLHPMSQPLSSRRGHQGSSKVLSDKQQKVGRVLRKLQSISGQASKGWVPRKLQGIP